MCLLLHVLTIFLLKCSEGTGAITACEDGWIAYHGSCYLFKNDQTYDNFDAERFCSRHQANLVFVNDIHENHFLINYMSQFGGSFYWIGITDELIEGDWTSLKGNNFVNFTNWSPGEPDSASHGANEDCAGAHKNYGYAWLDQKCGYLLLPICEKPGTNCNSEQSEIVG